MIVPSSKTDGGKGGMPVPRQVCSPSQKHGPLIIPNGLAGEMPVPGRVGSPSQKSGPMIIPSG